MRVLCETSMYLTPLERRILAQAADHRRHAAFGVAVEAHLRAERIVADA